MLDKEYRKNGNMKIILKMQTKHSAIRLFKFEQSCDKSGLNKNLYNFADLTPRHVLELCDKLVSPILCYISEVCFFFCKADKLERVH